MMTIDRGPDGAETFSLKPTGWGRFLFDIPFLGVWLAFWVVFEVAVIVLFGGMVAGVISSAFGIPLSFASRVTPDGSAPFFLLFMLVWLTFWTLGGIAAGTHFLRELAGRDVVSVSPDGLEIDWRAGPFRQRRTIGHGDIRRVRMTLQGDALVVETASGTVNVTTFGTREERAAILDSLKARLVLPDAARIKRLDAETAPPDWGVEVQGMETRLFWPTRRDRRIVAAILWGLAAMVFFAAFLPALQLNPDALERSWNGITGAQLTASGIAAVFALWAAWVTWGRSEWVVGYGRMTWRRRFGSWRRERSFENGRLEIERTFDSDGDARFTLRVRTATANRKISSSLHESADLVRLAEWLSARTHFPID
jgi:hypothetical protein